jgi:hypothetical protein
VGRIEGGIEDFVEELFIEMFSFCDTEHFLVRIVIPATNDPVYQ